MPGLSGLEFVQAVRAQPDLAAVRLMMVTTENEKDRVVQALEAGADEFLMKPFTVEAVREKLELLGLACPEQAQDDPCLS